MKNIAQFIFIMLMILGSLILTRCGKPEEPEPGNDTVTDYDGNVYEAVKIFTNIWMAENLRTSRLNDGKTIVLVPDNWNWDFLEELKRCYYNNDGQLYRDVYGHLYNYYAVSSGKLCPVGWHLPTKEEWGTLIGYLVVIVLQEANQKNQDHLIGLPPTPGLIIAAVSLHCLVDIEQMMVSTVNWDTPVSGGLPSPK